jgi:hypothetical protein
MRVPFFRVAERKEPKKGRPHCLRPLRFATGQPAVLGFGGVSLNSRRCASLRHTRALIRQTLRSSAHPQGQVEPNIHTGHRCARPRIAGASASRCAGAAERSNGPNGCAAVGCSAVHPLLAAPAAGRLRGGTRVGARVLRALTRRGCLNEAATQRSEFHGAPRNRTDAGLPLRNAKGSQTGGRLFFGDFLLAKQKKVTRSPGDSRPPPLTKACGPISNHKKTLQNQ